MSNKFSKSNRVPKSPSICIRSPPCLPPPDPYSPTDLAVYAAFYDNIPGSELVVCPNMLLWHKGIGPTYEHRGTITVGPYTFSFQITHDLSPGPYEFHATAYIAIHGTGVSFFNLWWNIPPISGIPFNSGELEYLCQHPSAHGGPFLCQSWDLVC